MASRPGRCSVIANKLLQTVVASDGPFDPSQLPGLTRWYSQSDIVNSGTSITQINDKSGGGNHATQATPTKRPAFVTNLGSGFNTISFDGIDDIVTFAAMTLTGDFTVYWVGYMRESDGAAGGFFGESASLAPLNYALNTYLQGTYWYVSGGDIVQGNNGLVNSGSFYTIVVRRTGAVITAEVNGVNNSTQPRNANPTIGEIGYAHSGYAKIDMCEFLVYTQYHSNANRDLFIDWVNTNYPDPYYEKISLLLNMDGTNGSTTFVDSGPNALTVTAVGDAHIATDATFETAGSFDGTGDYLSTPYNAVFNFGSGEFTFEAWIKPTASSGIRGIYATSGGGGGVPKFAIHLNGLTPSIHYNGLTNGSNIYTAATAAVTAGAWNHIAFTRSGTTWKWFINGVQSGSGTNSTVITFTNQSTYAAYGGESYFAPFLGLVGPMRVHKGIALTTFNLTPGKFPGLYNAYTTLPVSGAALWLDASQQNSLFTDAGVTPVNTNGQQIYQWNDLSGNNRHAVQATSANRPTWNAPSSGQHGFGTVGFNGTSQWLANTMPSLAAGYTIYAVLKNGGALAGHNPFCTANAGTLNSIATIYTDGTQIGLSQYGASVLQAASNGSVIGFVGKYDGTHTTGNYFIRNSQASTDAIGTMTQAAGTPAAGTANIGRSTDGTQYFSTPIMELIVFASYRSSADDAEIKAYFTDKWGINWS